MSTSDNKLPADWAIQRAIDEAWRDYNYDNKWQLKDVKNEFNTRKMPYSNSIIAHARMIEKYEKPPVDPDLVLARKHYALLYPMVGEGILKGLYDTEPQIKAIVAVIKEVRSQYDGESK